MEYRNNYNSQRELQIPRATDILTQISNEEFNKKYALNSIGTQRRTMDKERRQTKKKERYDR